MRLQDRYVDETRWHQITTFDQKSPDTLYWLNLNLIIVLTTYKGPSYKDKQREPSRFIRKWGRE